MANKNNIPDFTAQDIERYHRGELSPAKMNEMERAALEDPFLADALEGYAVEAVDAANDIQELKRRLARRTEGAKIIPISVTKQQSFPWLKVAAAIIVIVSAGWFANQFLFNQSAKGDIAKLDSKKETVRAAGESDEAIMSRDTVASLPPVVDSKKENSSVFAPAKPVPTIVQPVTDNDDLATVSTAPGNGAIVTPVIAPPVNVAEQKMANESIPKGEISKSVDRSLKEKQQADATVKKDNTIIGREQTAQRSQEVAASSKPAERDLYYQNSRTFRGRVTDASNIGVPFANVTNTEDDMGTYTDARGYFNLTSPDSVLNVQVRSIGFENNTTQLRSSETNTQVVMRDDRRGLSEVVISNQKPNVAARSRESNVKIEEPEPADGWDNYDAYLANNLHAPEDFKTKTALGTSVDVSFEVDKNGEAVNFKIEKSLCTSCDKEAIRLIKDGPKWKRKAKKGRTTVTINF